MGVGRVETDHSHVELRDPVELGRGEGEGEVETQRRLQLLVTTQQVLGVGDGTASELTFPCRVKTEDCCTPGPRYRRRIIMLLTSAFMPTRHNSSHPKSLLGEFAVFLWHKCAYET